MTESENLHARRRCCHNRMTASLAAVITCAPCVDAREDSTYPSPLSTNAEQGLAGMKYKIVHYLVDIYFPKINTVDW